MCGTERKARFTNLILLPERNEDSVKRNLLFLFYCPEREARFTNPIALPQGIRRPQLCGAVTSLVQEKTYQNNFRESIIQSRSEGGRHIPAYYNIMYMSGKKNYVNPYDKPMKILICSLLQ